MRLWAIFDSVQMLKTRDGLIMRMKEEDWMTVLETNLKGAFNTVKAFMRVMMKAEDARIVNIASVIGLIGNAGCWDRHDVINAYAAFVTLLATA